MFLARVDGTITSTVKHPSLKGIRLLIGQRLEWDGSLGTGEPVVFMDILGAMKGSRVIVSTDGEYAQQITKAKNSPSRFAVIGILDEHGEQK